MESTFQANDDKDMQILKPKSQGAGIMVSDFIEEHSGYLHLLDQKYEEAKLRRGIGRPKSSCHKSMMQKQSLRQSIPVKKDIVWYNFRP